MPHEGHEFAGMNFERDIAKRDERAKAFVNALEANAQSVCVLGSGDRLVIGQWNRGSDANQVANKFFDALSLARVFFFGDSARLAAHLEPKETLF